MAFTEYHNITGSTGVDAQLLAVGSGIAGLSSIMITNVHASNDATVTLFLESPTTGKTYNIIHTVAVPADSSLLIDDRPLLAFNNTRRGYSLNVTVGSSDTVDILLNTL